MRQQAKITKGEKRLFSTAACGLALLFGTVIWASARWWHNAFDDPVLHIPTVRLPSPNAFDFYLKAGRVHVALLNTVPGADAIDSVTDPGFRRGLSQQQLAKRYPTAAKEVWLRKNAAVLRMVRQGFKCQYLQPPGHKSLSDFSYFRNIRKIARLLVIESHARSERGDWSGASRSTLDILRLGQDMPRGGPYLSALVGYAVKAIGRKYLRDIMPRMNASAARTAAAQIEKMEANAVSYVEILQEEKWVGQAALQRMMREDGNNWVLFQMVIMPPSGNVTFTKRLQSMGKRRAMDDYTTYMNSLIARAKLPYASRQLQQIPDNSIAEFMTPHIVESSYKAARNETGNAFMEIELALHAFKLEHGAFPAKLSELVSSYLKAVPRDPYGGGEALRYRQTGNSYRLYSIGPDGKDDGGKKIDDPTPLKSNRSSDARYLVQPESKGDIVAGVNR